MWAKVIKAMRVNLLFLTGVLIFLIGCSEKENIPQTTISPIKEVKTEILEIAVRSQLDDVIIKAKHLPARLAIGDNEYNVEYFINDDLEAKIKDYISEWGPDFASVVVLDNKTGGVIAAVDYSDKTKKFGRKLTLNATHPAASVIKIVTAADLIQNHKISSKTSFKYNGRSTTLYKSQLTDTVNKWTTQTDFATAFSISNNVVFAKAAIKHSSSKNIVQMAGKMGFDEPLMKFVDLGESSIFRPTSEYGLAELATGFNKKTLISPVHGATLASIVANNGVLKKPQIVKSIKSSSEVIWLSEFEREHVVFDKKTAQELSLIMEKVVQTGSARKMFLKYPSRTLKKLLIAGKTGSITGGEPYGKRDWFVSFAKDKNNKKDAGISVAIMLVHGENWKVRSTLIARNIYHYYFSNN